MFKIIYVTLQNMRKLRIFTAKGDSSLEQKVIRCQTSAGKRERGDVPLLGV